MPAARTATRRATSSRPTLSRRESRWRHRPRRAQTPLLRHSGMRRKAQTRNPWRRSNARRNGFSGAQLRTIVRATARPGMTSVVLPGMTKDEVRPLLLLLLPERQQPLAGGATDHAGDSDRDGAQRCRRDAAERDRADADLAPEVQIAA